MLLKQIFDPALAQYAYLVGSKETGEAIIIDPERDIDRYLEIAANEGLKIIAATETHIHADFVSGITEFSADPSVKIYLSGMGGPDWNYSWPKDNSNITFLNQHSQFKIGSVRLDVLYTPGHTPEHISFLITDEAENKDKPQALISGDFIFVGDVGRPDLLESAAGVKNVMESSARVLKNSLQTQLSKFEDILKIYPGHGAGSSCGKALGSEPMTTLGHERELNGALQLALKNDESFVKEILQGQPNPPLYFSRMKKVNRDGIKITNGVPALSKLTSQEFYEQATNPGVKVLDTRNDRVAFDSAHFPGSINAPIKSSQFSVSAGSYTDENDKILLVLENLTDAEVAARQLYRIGFDNLLGWVALEDLERNNLLTHSIPRILFPEIHSKDGEIIDVRTTAEFERSHLNNARSFPYTRLKTSLAELPKDRKLLVHCGSGVRSAFAASFLQSEGFDAVHVDGNYSSP